MKTEETIQVFEERAESVRMLIASKTRESASFLQAVTKPTVPDASPLLARRFGSDEWSSLIDRIQATSEYIHEVETARQQQEMQAREIFDRMKGEIAAATARALAAERQLQEVQLRANTTIKGLQEQLAAAEERASEAEEWLTRISEVVRSTFRDP
ncbi:hypothetical protein [Methylobacterium sp. JK268]